jgi:hypothetical protein
VIDPFAPTGKPHTGNAELVGPTDADHYRIKVGRFNERWYRDPLESCEVADADPDWRGVSISAVKPPFGNKYYFLKIAAELADDEWRRLGTLTSDERYEQLKSREKLVGDVNKGRGTIVHRWAEDFMHRRSIWKPVDFRPAEAYQQARQYGPAIRQFFADHQPELYAAELVCLHRTLNGHGYGGTCDMIATIAGKRYVIDWKTRSNDHAAYPEEAAQVAGYARAEYVIVEQDGHPRRARVPDVDGGLIVSICRNGYRVYPVDLDQGFELFTEMHRWWGAQRAFDGIGAPWAPVKAVAA